MESEYRYTTASESELDELLVGHEAGLGIVWSRWSPAPRFTPGSTGVVWTRGVHPNDLVRPLALVSEEEDVRRLCGRYAQLRSDLSPLTAWCHLLTPQFYEGLEAVTHDSGLEGLEAAWTGLIVAEALLLADKPLSHIRIPACFATQSFAIARTRALWRDVSIEEIIRRFDSANRLCRSESATQRGESGLARLRPALQPIWTSLLGLSHSDTSHARIELQPIVASLRALQEARSNGDTQEAARMVAPLKNSVPETDAFHELANLTPEMRLRVFDKLVDALSRAGGDRNSLHRNALALLAGYLATVAAGGAPSLTLAEASAYRWPEITAWAYVVGGIGERVVWTSSFDGLGRLVARELVRPLRLDEPPMCDFAFDEASVLADSKLPDPLVHLRLKQARIASVAIFPGVNIAIPIADLALESSKPEATRPGRPVEAPVTSNASGNPLAAFADALWPYLRGRVGDYVRSTQGRGEARDYEDSQQNRGKRKSGSQSQLPLTNPKK